MHRSLGFGFAGALGLVFGVAAGACSSDNDEGLAEEGFGGSGTMTTSGTTSGTGTWGAGGGGEPQPPPNVAAPDAGPDTPIECAKLDPSKPLVLYLSADDSNSMASPVVAREMLSLGKAPHNAIRTYEFLNYYRIAYEAAPQGHLSIFPELAQEATPGEYLLQIGVRSFDAPKQRRPITVTFVLDTSGSMDGPGIERERAAVTAIAGALSEGDVVSMVRWDTTNTILLSGFVVSGPNDPVVLTKADGLTADGGTDLHAGLVAGYDLAKKHYAANRLNRVVLISDGGANVGVTDADLIAEHSKDADAEGIYLVGIGAGPAEGYSDALMDTVTDKGRGAYIYLDDPTEAAKILDERFDEAMEIAARGVQVQLTLPWYFQMEHFYGEEYSEDPKEVQPQHLAPSDAMVFDQIIKACDPSVVVPADTIGVKATWEEPLTYVEQETSVTSTVAALLGGSNTHLAKGKAIVAYAEALKVGTHEALVQAHDLVAAADPAKTDPELGEIRALIEKHPAYF